MGREIVTRPDVYKRQALGDNCRRLVMDSLRAAKDLGLTVSFDGNFRSALWTWEEARDFCTQCLPYVDVLLGIEPYHLWRDEELSLIHILLIVNKHCNRFLFFY